jgi:hypothetical protein
MHIKETVFIFALCIHLPGKIQGRSVVTETMFILRMRYLQVTLPAKKQIS